MKKRKFPSTFFFSFFVLLITLLSLAEGGRRDQAFKQPVFHEPGPAPDQLVNLQENATYVPIKTPDDHTKKKEQEEVQTFALIYLIVSSVAVVCYVFPMIALCWYLAYIACCTNQIRPAIFITSAGAVGGGGGGGGVANSRSSGTSKTTPTSPSSASKKKSGRPVRPLLPQMPPRFQGKSGNAGSGSGSASGGAELGGPSPTAPASATLA